MRYYPTNQELDAVSVGIQEADLRQLYLLKKNHQLVIALLFGALFFILVYWLLLSHLPSELSERQLQEEQLKKSYVVNLEKLAGVPSLRREIEAIKQSSGSLLNQLSGNISAADIVQEFYEAGAKNGLRIAVNRHLEVKEDGPLIVGAYEIEVKGTYLQLERFCLDLGKLSTVVILTDFTLSLDSENSESFSNVTSVRGSTEPVLHLKVVANTYQAKR
ncbi:MAG: type 4a pilus biogenesis protein PilO [Neisseriaceae bacterium]